MIMKKKGIVVSTFAVLLLLYVGIYLALSLQGRYEPACIGPAGVKWYAWEPRGYPTLLNQPKWRWVLRHAFSPLWVLDVRFWHTTAKAWYGEYPINLEDGDVL
jgi:hypothetical protein